jgi:uncharacterized tellurite resistance protein B-like protein
MGRSITARLLDAIYELSGVRLGADVFPATRDTETAVASVLALAALSDGSVSTEESERLVIILRRNFDLEAGTALALITRAIHELPVHDGMSKLLKELNSALSVRNKESLIVMLLEVIAADGRKEAEEMEVLANFVFGLGLSARSMDRAYERYFSSRRGKADEARRSP